MAHGFVKFERLFTGSKRRGRARQKSAQELQKTAIINARRPSSPVFPSPSFLRPTSINMMPRDAQIDGPETDKGRSKSLPSLQEVLHKRSSATSSITIVNVNSRSGRSGTMASNSQSEPCSSNFQFKEDSLFMDEKMLGSSEAFHKKAVPRDLSPRTRDIKHSSGKGLLDWAPKHISLLFNPLEFNASSNDHPWGSRSDGTESTLLPSPSFAPLSLSASSCDSIDDLSKPTVATAPLVRCNSVQKLTINLRRQSLLSRGEPSIRSAPATDSNLDKLKSEIHRSMSLGSLGLSRPDSTCLTSTELPTRASGNFRGRRSDRETWGNRMEDPQSTGFSKSHNEVIPRSKLRRSASTSTLSKLTLQISEDRILKEPTFDDFYALSDDDIAESCPPTPVYDARVPPTPPPKDNNKYLRNSYRKSRLSHSLASRHVAPRFSQEVTPSYYFTDHYRLALTYSPTSARDTYGALRAAELAMKYDFAVLYVLNLWPVDSNHSLDATKSALGGLPRSFNAAAARVFPASARASGINGRLLAAYGLNEVPSPFEIVTDTHLAALNCDYWNEYRNVDARPDDISRGWICPFYNDYTTVSAPWMATSNPGERPPRNRGIVFAAYSKQRPNPVIPLRASPEQQFLLRQLSADAKDLVDSLVFEPLKGRQGPRNPGPKTYR
ncbi:hypothetical protein GGS21DRAFT_85417 [Xylaria nigripes]|nr:hypothetical protein GGS21DRAFT_85417 [Xylaria nigripes]